MHFGMKFQSTFSEILELSRRSWTSRRVDASILSLAVPIKSIDPLFENKQHCSDFKKLLKKSDESTKDQERFF